MDPTVAAAIIGALGLLGGAVITAYAGKRKKAKLLSGAFSGSGSGSGSDLVVPVTERDFFAKLNLDDIVQLRIIAHTGKRLFQEVYTLLDDRIKADGRVGARIQVVTRRPAVESFSRSKKVAATLHSVADLREKGIDIDVRFFEGLPAVRGAICDFADGTRSSYMSMYEWHGGKSQAFDRAFVRHAVRGDDSSAERLLRSWFDHYWGHGEIHTVVFDFDDTIAITAPIQVEAWSVALRAAVQCGEVLMDWLAPEIRAVWDSEEELRTAVRRVFAAELLAPAIGPNLIPGAPSSDAVASVDRRRFMHRLSLMHGADLWEGAFEAIRNLSERYNLAIISATDEQMIRDYLRAKKLDGYFTVVLGKRDPGAAEKRGAIDDKAYLLIKLSALVGIPLDRAVYVGDNRFDWEAARQVEVDFVEARMAAQSLGKDSLLGPGAGKVPSFDSYRATEVERVIDSIENTRLDTKYFGIGDTGEQSLAP